MKILEDYHESLAAIYEHVGFEEDWVICPISDETEMYWDTDGSTEVKYAKTEEGLNNEEEYYCDDIYTQRYYDKHIYEGKDFTMIFCDPHVDGMKWFRIFDNSKRIK
jgi:hypothetical protein